MYIVEIENEARQLMKYVEFNSIYVIYIWGSLNSMDQYCVPSIIASVGMHKAASIYMCKMAYLHLNYNVDVSPMLLWHCHYYDIN